MVTSHSAVGFIRACWEQVGLCWPIEIWLSDDVWFGVADEDVDGWGSRRVFLLERMACEMDLVWWVWKDLDLCRSGICVVLDKERLAQFLTSDLKSLTFPSRDQLWKPSVSLSEDVDELDCGMECSVDVWFADDLEALLGPCGERWTRHCSIKRSVGSFRSFRSFRLRCLNCFWLIIECCWGKRVVTLEVGESFCCVLGHSHLAPNIRSISRCIESLTIWIGSFNPNGLKWVNLIWGWIVGTIRRLPRISGRLVPPSGALVIDSFDILGVWANLWECISINKLKI